MQGFCEICKGSGYILLHRTYFGTIIVNVFCRRNASKLQVSPTLGKENRNLPSHLWNEREHAGWERKERRNVLRWVTLNCRECGMRRAKRVVKRAHIALKQLGQIQNKDERLAAFHVTWHMQYCSARIYWFASLRGAGGAAECDKEEHSVRFGVWLAPQLSLLMGRPGVV